MCSSAPPERPLVAPAVSWLPFDAIESLRLRCACDLGLQCIRVVTLPTGGVPEVLPEVEGRERIVEGMEKITGETERQLWGAPPFENMTARRSRLGEPGGRNRGGTGPPAVPGALSSLGSWMTKVQRKETTA
jgi:hypothetical protein